MTVFRVLGWSGKDHVPDLFVVGDIAIASLRRNDSLVFVVFGMLPLSQ
jgi:hypothetical protein